MSETGANLQLQSNLRRDGRVEVALVDIGMPEPDPDEVVVKVRAAPLNPSDLSLLMALADSRTAVREDVDGRPVVRLSLPQPLADAQSKRWGRPLPVGAEGAGEVVLAGSGAAAQALLGRAVAIWGGGMYVQYRAVRAADLLLLPDNVDPAQGASAFVNPLTALGMVETMREEGFSGLVHTAAASNLGRMLVRLCRVEKIPLVCIVRSPKQAVLLRSIGAEHVCDTSVPGFLDDLVAALRATGATLAFDAIGGGPLLGQILSAMERVAAEDGAEYSLYGTTTPKKVYVYGALDPRPIEVPRGFGTSWTVGGWLLMTLLDRVGPGRTAQLKERVADELQGIFASEYGKVVALADLCDPETLQSIAQRSTGGKYLVDPSL